MSGLGSYDAIMLLSYGGPNGEEGVLPFMRNATRGRGIRVRGSVTFSS